MSPNEVQIKVLSSVVKVRVGVDPFPSMHVS